MRRVGVLLAAVALAGGCGSGRGSHHVATAKPVHLRGIAARPPMRAPELALRDQDGRVVRLSAQRGRVVLVTFLYTGCTDVCPLIASNLSAAVRSLPAPERDRVRVLAVSVDPRGDTRAAVRRFVARRALVRQFRYLVGTRAELAPVWQSWNVLVEPRNLERVEHSALIWLVDASGRTRASYGADVTAAVVAHDLRALASA